MWIICNNAAMSNIREVKSGFTTFEILHAMQQAHWFMWQSCIKFCTIIKRWQSHLITTGAAGSRQQQRGWTTVLWWARGGLEHKAAVTWAFWTWSEQSSLVKLRSYTAGRMPEVWRFMPLQERDPLLCCLGAPESSLLFPRQCFGRFSPSRCCMLHSPRAGHM